MTIGKIFRNALEAAVAEQQAVVLDYGDKKTFVGLWEIDEGGSYPVAIGNSMKRDENCNGQSEEKIPIIIIWDGRAVGGEDAWANLLKPHLTPMDWALAFSIRALGQMMPNRPNVTIHIVDLTGQDHDAWSMRMRHQLLADMPWVTLHAPLIPQAVHRIGYRPILNGCNSLLTNNGGKWTLTNNGGKWTLQSEVETLKEYSSRGCGRNLTDMTRQWVSTLVQSHDHHDLNNLVGPWILSSATPEQLGNEIPSLSAFWTRLRWTGFLPEGTPETGTDLGVGELDVLAIDDQLNTGWNHVICRLFGAQENGGTGGTKNCPLIGTGNLTRVYGSEEASILLDSLKCPGKYETRLYDSAISCRDGQRPWILVLDLLLFSGKPTEEREWFKNLLCIAKKIVGSRNGLAWPGFSGEEIKGVEEWLQSSGNHNDLAYDTALSLLPRLCALRWPSVPIMLFSGTARRALVARLADYRNISLAPPKPNLFAGNPQEQVDEFESGWRREIDSTKGLIRVQKKLLQLIDAPDGAATNPRERVHRHLTIAIDESGDFAEDKYSAVGGVVIEAAAEDSGNSARCKTFEFLEALRKGGVHFYDHVPAYTEIKKVGELVCDPCIPKEICIQRQVSCVKSKHKDCRLGSFRCLIPKRLYSAASGPFSDGTYLAFLRATLELLLSEYLFSLDYDLETTSLSVWLPTRTVPVTQWDEAVRRDEAVRMDFDIHGKRIQTIGGKSVAYAIVRAALGSRGSADQILKKVTSLKLRKIPYYSVSGNSVSGNRYESAINWYCGGCKDYSGGVPKGRLKRLKANGKNITYCAKDHGECWAQEGKHKEQFLAADYSVAQHLADASLSNSIDKFPHSKIGTCNIESEISFDVVADRRLTDFLEVGRLFDSELKTERLKTEGFKLAYHHSFFVAGINRKSSPAKARVAIRIVRELRNHAKCIDGNTLVELAGLSRPITRITVTEKRGGGGCLDNIYSEAKQILERLLDDVPGIQRGTTKGNNPKLTFDIDTADENEIRSSLDKIQSATINYNRLQGRS